MANLINLFSGTFTPRSIPNLVAWYDFSDITTLWQDTARTSAITANGQTIKGVTDKSTSGFHLSEATNGPTYEASGQNGRGTALFDGVNDQLRSAAVSQAQPYTMVYAVGIVSYEAANITDLSDVTTTGGFVYAGTAGQGTWLYNSGANVASATARDLNFNTHTAVFHGATSTLRHNGAVGANGNPSTGTLSGLSLGSDTFSNWFNLRYGEWLLYSGNLGTAQLQQLETYSKSKWATP